jgi:hypothetical protein
VRRRAEQDLCRRALTSSDEIFGNRNVTGLGMRMVSEGQDAGRSGRRPRQGICGERRGIIGDRIYDLHSSDVWCSARDRKQPRKAFSTFLGATSSDVFAAS